ncbi:hypothetical protein CLG96_00080 [Sphingomonas oleivorans]|uniref:Uncharacterized protein n=1 Tax=Sphingomonas oleivorans TaxID=1735121 RepID=A0A2T5G3E2_9SPHN|nr:hypothetical protein [Sphingomonas oleivorans]PTQ13718.1 hypothetical protein CLG96_00080 [Sphingomonas oleivorans]
MIAAALAFFRTSPRPALVGLALAAVLICGILWIRHIIAMEAERDRLAMQVREQASIIAILRKDAAAREQAAIERQADTARIEAIKDEVIDEIHKAPDASPSAARLRLNCQRLRRAGRHEADLPAGCRSGGGA